MYEGGEQGDDRGDLTYGEALDGQHDEDRLDVCGIDGPECQFLCCVCDHKEDQAEDDDIFQPHFFNGESEDLIAQSAEFQGDGVGRHAENHAEDHDCGEDDALKFCFWHNNTPFSGK